MTDDIPLVIADANVLFPASLRDTIFRISESGLARVRLSDAIWNEVTGMPRNSWPAYAPTKRWSLPPNS